MAWCWNWYLDALTPAMLAYKADVLDGLYEWTAILDESEFQNQPQIRLTAFMIILTYIWRVTNNHFTVLLCNPAVPPPVLAYSRIQEHLMQGMILHLMALPNQVMIKTFMLPASCLVTRSIPSTISSDVRMLMRSRTSTGSIRFSPSQPAGVANHS